MSRHLTIAASLGLFLSAAAPAQMDHTSHAPAMKATAAPRPGAALAKAVADPARKPANRARDPYRHPAETLAFFGIKPTDTVVEIWPMGGWYSEILAPYLAQKGTLYGAGIANQLPGMRQFQASDPARFGKVKIVNFPAFSVSDPRVPDGSADAVLTFRNVHNWRMGYQRDNQDYSAEAFKQIARMLKPGGVLGVEDHRLPESADAERERKSGYVKESTVIRLAEAAGLKLVARSEINANPKDTADWPSGVWTLPPSYALKDVDRAKYAAIGESDRMTLKFVKPK